MLNEEAERVLNMLEGLTVESVTAEAVDAWSIRNPPVKVTFNFTSGARFALTSTDGVIDFYPDGVTEGDEDVS